MLTTALRVVRRTLRFWRKFHSIRARTFLRMIRVAVLISKYRVKMVVNPSVPYDCFELQAPGLSCSG